MRQHPGSNNCVEGAYGIARFARARARGERWACEIDLRGARAAPAACAALCAAAGGRRAAADVDRLLVANGCGGERAMLAAPRAEATPPRSTNRVTYALARNLNRPRAPHCLDHFFG